MATLLNLGTTETMTQYLNPPWLYKGAKLRIQIVAMGDVGGTVLTGLKLLGGDIISSIGIFDMNDKAAKRWEMELNQVSRPFAYDELPPVRILKDEDLFDCDVFCFCASVAVPKVGSQVTDVRMAQYKANKPIVEYYATLASSRNYKGLFAVISDPIDPLCQAALKSSKGGLHPQQIQGFGLGVMNARAAYYAQKESCYSDFLTEGRAFGPHGDDLVIANSIEHYDDERSKCLTHLAVHSNLITRQLGYKPYVAPALSSAALSLLLTIRGKWHYSSNNLNGVYFGSLNRTEESGLTLEILELPDDLFTRIQTAYNHLAAIN